MKKEIKRATQSFWRLLLLMVAFNSSLSLFAQTQTISGIVLDEFGEPMIGVSVLVKGTTTGIITDVEGNFTVPAKTGDVLLVKYLGYKDQEIKVTSDARLKITLHEDTQNLDEVVVVGYGTQKKVNLTGAVSAVTGEEIAKRPVANTSTMLQGQMPGLRITSDKGQPGSESVQIRVRGQGTYSGTGSDPLILINGVEGDLASLDPNIIESVSVLKDAASASIYGSRAANGVILITTKNGSEVKERFGILLPI